MRTIMTTPRAPVSIPVRAGLALLIGLAVAAAILALALLAVTTADGGPWPILLGIFHQVWAGRVAAAISFLLLPTLTMAPLVAVVAIAAIVELAKPGHGSYAHTRPPRPAHSSPWT